MCYVTEHEPFRAEEAAMESRALKYLFMALAIMTMAVTSSIGPAGAIDTSDERPVEGPQIP